MIRDTDIIDHYWQRDQRAISESDEKYGAYCRAVAMNIVGDERDGEECVSDTWLAAWNTMPPKRPARLSAYFAAICRNSALNIVRREVRALREFKQRYSENCGQWSEQVQGWYTPMDIRLAVPGNMDEATAAVRDEICAKYALTAPESAEEYSSADETALAHIGQQKFSDADLSIRLSYDTGAFTASGRAPASFELDYITKGSLYINTWSTAFRFLDDAPSWMYKTANGDEVCIVLGGWGYGCVIYESANAYVLLSASGFVPASITGGDSVPDGMAAYRMERLADSVEFSRLK